MEATFKISEETRQSLITYFNAQLKKAAWVRDVKLEHESEAKRKSVVDLCTKLQSWIDELMKDEE